MPTRRLTTVDRGGSFDLVVLDEDGAEIAIARGDFGGALQIGPAWWEDVVAAGLSGLPFRVANGSPPSIVFDSADLDGTQQSTLAATIIAHDPRKAATPNTRVADLLSLEAQAVAIRDGNGNLTTEAKAFAIAFLAWSADSPER